MDVDPSEIGKLVPVTVGIVGDARAALRALADAVPEPTGHNETLERWIAEVHELRAKFEPRQAYRRRPDSPTLQPHDVCALLNAARHEHGPSRIVTDVGQHQMWAAQLLDWRRPRSHLTSGGSGTMGFAVPAALGAAVACPDETIWVIVGDGGFQMTNQEIATMRAGRADQRQDRHHEQRLPRHGAPVAAAVRGEALQRHAAQRSRLREARRGVRREGRDRGRRSTRRRTRSRRRGRRRAIVVIDFRVEREANVFPIVPQGQSIGDMLVDPTTKAEHHEPAAAGATQR